MEFISLGFRVYRGLGFISLGFIKEGPYKEPYPLHRAAEQDFRIAVLRKAGFFGGVGTVWSEV